MNFTAKFKETVFSVLPVMAIVLILGVTAAPLGGRLIVQFLIGGLLLIIGLTAFLMGVDIGIQPIGERTGAALVSKRNLFLLLGVSFVIGFLVTVAEPDIQVFGDQVHSVFQAVQKAKMVYMIALGVGIFIVFGLVKTMLQLNLKILLGIAYLAVFVLAFFTPEDFRGIAFDSGGATTGPMTVPFILALGVGVSAVRSGSKKNQDNSDDFGLTGITSIGPVVAVLLYGLVLAHGAGQNVFVSEGGAVSGVDAVSVAESVVPVAENGSVPGGVLPVADGALPVTDGALPVAVKNLSIAGAFFGLIPHVAKEAGLSILPLALMLIVFQFTLLHLPPRQLARMAVGLVWSYLGLTIFLIGVNGGFMEAGTRLGFILGEKASTNGGFWRFLLIFTGLVLGAVVVCAEPAVWVLTEQVENLSGGTIRRKFMLVFLSAGAAVAIGLTMWRAIAGFSLMKILVPGYAIALLLMFFSPRLFTAIAFDSGGVASGPITSTFVLSFTLGASRACGAQGGSFGVIALVAMTPLIAIQILGILFSKKNKRNKQGVS